MSFFGKKADTKLDAQPNAARLGQGSSRSYGIEDAIRLMREQLGKKGIPVTSQGP